LDDVIQRLQRNKEFKCNKIVKENFSNIDDDDHDDHDDDKLHGWLSQPISCPFCNIRENMSLPALKSHYLQHYYQQNDRK